MTGPDPAYPLSGSFQFSPFSHETAAVDRLPFPVLGLAANAEFVNALIKLRAGIDIPGGPPELIVHVREAFIARNRGLGPTPAPVTFVSWGKQ